MRKINAVERDLRAKLKENGNDSAVFDEIVKEYAEMCADLDDVRKLADQVKDDPKQGGLYIRCLSRKSQIEKDKRDTLRYLGIVPAPAKPEPAEENYDL